MDTTRDIIFRNFYLNDSTVASSIDAGDGLGMGIDGCVVTDFDPDDVDVVQFQEKRAEADGVDVGDPFLGGRRIRIAGTIYGKTRALAYDNLFALRAVMNPVLSAREIPDDKGYLPLYFAVPTNDTANFPSGAKAMRALVMPRGFRAPIDRDTHGGTDADGLAFNWTGVMVMREPNFEGSTPQDVVFADTTVVTGATGTAATDLVNKTSHGLVAGDRIYFTTLTGGSGLALNTSYYVISDGLTTDNFKVSTSIGGGATNIATDYSAIAYAEFQTITGDFTNRGTYSAPLNMIFAVGAGAGTITVTAGGSNFTIAIPASTGMRIIRFKRDKLITVEESGVESLKRSWLTFNQSTTWPLIAPGTSAYTITINGTTLDPGSTDGSHMWFWEMYA